MLLVQNPRDVATTGSRPTNSGMRPYFNKVLGLDLHGKSSPVPRSSGAITLGAEADRSRPAAAPEMIFSSPIERAAPHIEQDVGGVDLQELLLRVLASTLRLRQPTTLMVPSMILSSACCTPSPETSRGVYREGCLDLRLIYVDFRRYRRCQRWARCSTL